MTAAVDPLERGGLVERAAAARTAGVFSRLDKPERNTLQRLLRKVGRGPKASAAGEEKPVWKE